MSQQKNLKSALLAAGVQLPASGIDPSVIDFLNDAVNSDTLSLAEKIELLCDALPSIQKLERCKVEKVISEVRSSCKSSSHVNTATSTTKKLTDDETRSQSSSEKVRDKIKLILESADLEGADIIEVELVEYFVTYLEELGNVNDQLSDAELDGFKELLTSFLTEVDMNSEALHGIAMALLAVNNEKRVLKTREEISASSSSNSLLTSDSCSSSKSREANVTARDKITNEISAEEQLDINFLLSMMPHITEDVIYYVYKLLCGSNRVEAGQYLVERSDDEGMAKLRESKRAYDKKESEAAKLSAIQKKKMKDRVCNKYGETLVSDGKGIEPKKKILLPIQFVDAKDKDSKVRIFIPTVPPFGYTSDVVYSLLALQHPLHLM
jgi:hypothetical protein